MSNMWLYLVLFIFTIQSFTFSYRYFGVVRSFSGLGQGLVECHIEYLGNEEHPYFQSETLEAAVIEFLSLSLSDYTNQYGIDFLYYDRNAQSLCTSYCQRVIITLKVDLTPFDVFYQSKSFAIIQNYESTID